MSTSTCYVGHAVTAWILLVVGCTLKGAAVFNHMTGKIKKDGMPIHNKARFVTEGPEPTRFGRGRGRMSVRHVLRDA